MNYLELKSPEQLTAALNSLNISPKRKKELNRKLANRTRQFFRGQIRTQRDIDNNPYQARRRRVTTKFNGETARNTQNNKNMLLGLGRSLKTVVTGDNFQVGLSGLPAKIGRIHNDGKGLSFTTRVNGFFNAATNKWEGGVRVKGNYTMPKRTFIGWTPSLERELLAMISAELLENMDT